MPFPTKVGVHGDSQLILEKHEKDGLAGCPHGLVLVDAGHLTSCHLITVVSLDTIGAINPEDKDPRGRRTGEAHGNSSSFRCLVIWNLTTRPCPPTADFC